MARPVIRDARSPYSYRDDARVPDFPDDHPIIVFDGHCVLCSKWARFVIRHDRQKKFKLLAAQSSLGHALYEHYGLDPVDYKTNILIADGVAWFESESSVRMLEGLGAPWSWFAITRILPCLIRDRAYAVVARNRFRLFGRREVCFAPTDDIKERFLE
ncbi:MAG: thiol-disulfide oxidoreductase DCC family protein [Hyphomicrobiaceae bacterium]